MATPLSSASASATPTDFITFMDKRRLGDMDLDTDARDASPEASALIQAHLDAARGEIEMYAIAGGRYTPDDLAFLAGVGLGLMKKLECYIAWPSLLQRRTSKAPEKNDYMVLWSQGIIDALLDGKAIFGLAEAAAAAGIDPTPLDERTNAIDLMVPVSRRATRLFGRRGNTYP